jgi:eukaryotic-like serine/threonine-protein kinase
MPHDGRETEPVTQTVKRDAPTEPAAPDSGDVLLGRFKLVRLLGRGGMGEVYESRDLRLHVTVALKTIRASSGGGAELLERLRREVQLARAVTHPHVCRLFDFHEGNGPDGNPVAFITMEFLDGPTLGERLRSGPLSAKDALLLLQQMAEGLAAIHTKALVHRDFKPGNVMLVQERQRTRAVVTDFGIARPAHPDDADTGWSGTEVGALVGSPAYMAPEQRAGGEVTARTDIYALGLVTHEMVTGRLPDGGALGRLPRGWAGPLRRALDHDPSRRYGDPLELVPALERGRRRLLSLGAIGTMAALLLTGGSIAYRYWPAPIQQAIADPNSIAVLPLTSLGGSPDEGYFSAGLTEDILIQLTKVRGLHVLSHSSTEPYKGNRKPLRQIAAELGVATVLVGSVRRIGDRMRIAAELVDARSDEHLWAEMYDLEATDVLAVQREVADKVATALALQLAAPEGIGPTRGATTSPRAYDAYLHGVSMASQRTAEGSTNTDASTNLRAIAEFQRAVALDPDYALAHAWLATLYTRQAMFLEEGKLRLHEEWAAKASVERQRALALEPALVLSPPYAPPALSAGDR